MCLDAEDEHYNTPYRLRSQLDKSPHLAQKLLFEDYFEIKSGLLSNFDSWKHLHTKL